VLYDPYHGTVELYARAGGQPGSHLVERYWTGQSGWSAWADLTGDVSGGPVLLYNPNLLRVEIYANAAGQVVQRSGTAREGWGGWNSLGGSVTGDPVAVVNSWTGNVEVYAVSGGQLVARQCSAATGAWGAWTGL
jgi:hypothetical protein